MLSILEKFKLKSPLMDFKEESYKLICNLRNLIEWLRCKTDNFETLVRIQQFRKKNRFRFFNMVSMAEKGGATLCMLFRLERYQLDTQHEEKKIL